MAPVIAAAPKAPRCEVRLGIGRLDLPSTGGEFSISSAMTPGACAKAAPIPASWIQVVDPAKLRFVAQPNLTNAVREATIVVGDASFYVSQDPPVQLGLAAAPGRLVFSVDKKGKSDTKRLAAWSEVKRGELSARGGHPWLLVKPRKGPKDRTSYEVTVQKNAGLGPGRYDSYVELAPSTGASAPLRIPVVVEVFGKM